MPWGFSITNPVTGKRVMVGPSKNRSAAKKEMAKRRGKNKMLVDRKSFGRKP